MAKCVSSLTVRAAFPVKYASCGESPATQKCRKVEVVKETEAKPGFCCGYHSSIFDSSFDSDDDLPSHNPPKRSGKMTFLNEIPFDAKHHLVLVRNKRDCASQCEVASDRSLAEFACEEVRPGDEECVGVRQANKYPKTVHLPEYTQPKLSSVSLWNQFPEVPMCDSHPVECPYCGQRFSSGQALGGHTSRRHSSKRPSHHSSRLTLRPKRQRLLSISEI